MPAGFSCREEAKPLYSAVSAAAPAVAATGKGGGEGGFVNLAAAEIPAAGRSGTDTDAKAVHTGEGLPGKEHGGHAGR